ncbi:Hsp70 family protein [Pseudarthrobacter sp. NPDC080039]|uniref:Hsp70 family protein n=1 Tax=unclassified Pseudarthrobacter TaxID=2647000 RepID=UPI003450A649
MDHQPFEVPMSYALAVDVGTSFTAAAVVRFHKGASPVPESLPLGSRGASVPSVLYFPEEGAVLVGEAAERRGLDSPERVVREFKRRIGDDVPIILGTLALQPEEVFATMARWVADRAAEREGGPPSALFLTHPAAWGIHRLSVIRDALAAHGLENITLLPEPEAAALHYASQVRVDEGSTIAVYDLGGGTFDTAVLRKSGSSRFDLMGRPEGIEDLGGADFDAAVFGYVAAHTGTALNDLDPTDPAVLGALARLRRECVEAKEALSVDSEANIPVFLPGVHQQVRLVRSEFEALIDEPLRETVEALQHSLSQLHLEPADLSTVLLIGGSSRIPLVAELVSERLDRPIAVDADPKSSICLGAAVAALLAFTSAAEAAAAEAAAADGAEAPGSRGDGAGATAAVGPPVPIVPTAPPAPTMPSWSRKYTTVAGDGKGKGGAHAPKPTVRVTAVAAAAAVLTILTATAAQSPDGFGSLTAMFVPQAGASTTGGSVGAGGTEGPHAGGAAAAVPRPLAGVEASASTQASQEATASASAQPTGHHATGGEGTAAAGGAHAGSPVPAGAAPAASAPSSSNGSTAGSGIVLDAATITATPPPGTPSPVPTTPPTTITTPTASPTPTGSGAGGTATPVPAVSPTPVSATGTPVQTDVPTATASPDPGTTPTQLSAEASPTPQDTALEPTATATETAVATTDPTTPPAA